jgi:hypothetical protein
MGPCHGTFFRNIKRTGKRRCGVSFSPQTREIFKHGFEKERGTAPHQSFKAEAAN